LRHYQNTQASIVSTFAGISIDDNVEHLAKTPKIIFDAFSIEVPYPLEMYPPLNVVINDPF